MLHPWMFECRGNVDDERTEKKKNRSNLCLQTICPSVLFDLWSSWFIRAEVTDVSFPWYFPAEMADVLSPWYTRAEMTRVLSPWYTRADMTDVLSPWENCAEMTDVSYCSWHTCAEMIKWDSDFMRWSMSGMIPCIEKPIQELRGMSKNGKLLHRPRCQFQPSLRYTSTPLVHRRRCVGINSDMRVQIWGGGTVTGWKESKTY